MRGGVAVRERERVCWLGVVRREVGSWPSLAKGVLGAGLEAVVEMELGGEALPVRIVLVMEVWLEEARKHPLRWRISGRDLGR